MFVQVYIEGFGYLDVDLFHSNISGYSQYEHINVNVSKINCPYDHFYANKVCNPCLLCQNDETELKTCTLESNRICKKIEVIVDDTYISQNEVEILKRLLEGKLIYNYNVSQYVFLNSSNNISLFVTPKECPVNMFINTSVWRCQQCSICQTGHWTFSNCSKFNDTKCQKCKSCQKTDVVTSSCSVLSDTVCQSSIHVEIEMNEYYNIDQNILLYLIQKYKAKNFSLIKKENVSVRQCSSVEYFYNQSCRQCNYGCYNDTYVYSNCSKFQNTVCKKCIECQSNEYALCPCTVTKRCPTGQRTCASYSFQSVGFTFEAKFYNNYFLNNLLHEFNAQSYVITSLNSNNFSVSIENIRYQIVQSNFDFNSIITRALYNVSFSRRRMLQFCSPGAYIFYFPEPLGLQCIPCQCLPNMNADEFTPPFLYYYLDDSLCDNNQLWTCNGISRFCSGIRPNITVKLEITIPLQTFCEEGKVLKNVSGLILCAEPDCAPGYEGQPGYCTACKKGFVKDFVGVGPCIPCPVNFFSFNNSCLPCPGSSISSLASDKCYCGPGKIEPLPCFDCLPGYFENFEETCEGCPMGTFSSGLGSFRCNLCVSGTYNSMIGSTSCSKCNYGFFQDKSGATICLHCEPGTYTSDKGLQECSSCQSGKYSLSQASVCSLCLPGTFSQSGSSQCISCFAGTYSTGGSEFCHFCPPNTFSKAGFSNCSACQEGYYAQTASSVCVQCPPGYGAIQSGCEPCTSGYFSETGVCRLCKSNTFSPTPKSVFCYACLSGKYSLPGWSECLLCPLNTFGQNCTECSWGQVTYKVGSVSCEKCPEGTFKGIGFCKNCPSNTYSDNYTCIECPINNISPPGSSKKEECMAKEGYYSLPGKEGKKCPQNYYCIAGSMKPTVCPESKRSEAGSAKCHEIYETPYWLTWSIIPFWISLCCICGVCMSFKKIIGTTLIKNKIKLSINI